MAYATLQHGKSWLHAERSPLNAAAKSAAESWATLRVDELFFDWNRDDWDTTTPAEIAEIADLLASGRYLEMAVVGPGSEAAPEKSWGPALIRKGEERAEQVKSQGGPFFDSDRRSKDAPIRSTGFGRMIRLEPS